jgi:hypothetical protein
MAAQRVQMQDVGNKAESLKTKVIGLGQLVEKNA